VGVRRAELPPRRARERRDAVPQLRVAERLRHLAERERAALLHAARRLLERAELRPQQQRERLAARRAGDDVLGDGGEQLEARVARRAVAVGDPARREADEARLRARERGAVRAARLGE